YGCRNYSGNDAGKLDIRRESASHTSQSESSGAADNDSDYRHGQPFTQYTGEQRAWSRSDGQADTELTDTRADGKRQHTRHSDNRYGESNAGKTTEHQGIQPLWRQRLKTDVFQRCRTLDRLIRCQVVSNPIDRRNNRVRIPTNARKQARPPFLIERMVDHESRCGSDLLIVDIRNNTDDTSRRGRNAHEFRDAVGPRQLPVDRILSGEEFLRDPGTDNHNFLGAVAIRIVEIAALQDGNPESCKIARRRRSKPGMRIILRIRV